MLEPTNRSGTAEDHKRERVLHPATETNIEALLPRIYLFRPTAQTCGR